MNLKWLTNIYNPDSPFADISRINEDRNWLNDKIIGEPKETKFVSVESLKQMDMVGVYVNEQDEQD